MIVKNISEVLCNTAIYEKVLIDDIPFVIPGTTENSGLNNLMIYGETQLYLIDRDKIGKCIIGINTSLKMKTRIKEKWLSSNQSDMFSTALSIVIEENNRLTINMPRLIHWIKEYGIPVSKDTKMNVFAYFPLKDKYAFCSYIPVNKFTNKIMQLYCCYNLWKAAIDNDILNIKKYSKMLKSEAETVNDAFDLLTYKIKGMLAGLKINFSAIPEYSLFYNEATSIYSLLFYQLACFISGKDSANIRLHTCEVCGEMFYANHGNEKY